MLTAPGIPAMLQGTEWLEDTDFGTDSRATASTGRRRRPTRASSPTSRTSSRLGRRSPALRADAGVDVFHLNESGNVLAFQRYDLLGERASSSSRTSATPTTRATGSACRRRATGYEEINSQATEYDGQRHDQPGHPDDRHHRHDGFAQSKAIAIPSKALIVLTWGTGTGVEDGGDEQVVAPRLLGAYPNPFNPRTTVAFELPEEQRVRLAVYDVAGREVALLADDIFEQGRSSLTWNATSGGEALASGVYFVTMDVAGERDSQKVVLLR